MKQETICQQYGINTKFNIPWKRLEQARTGKEAVRILKQARREHQRFINRILMRKVRELKRQEKANSLKSTKPISTENAPF